MSVGSATVAPTSLRVPYITAWSEEAVPADLAFAPHPEAAGPRLTYVDPVPQDWLFGVLWARQGISRRGKPEWRLVNARRQRRAMLHRLCQVCGQDATDRGTGRVWWLLANEPSERGTNAPPTCRACIPEAVVSCPRLRRSATACTVGDYEPSAVFANVYRPGFGGPVATETSVEIPLDAFAVLERAMATQLLVTLHDLRPA